jgi:hypothetical protein
MEKNSAFQILSLVFLLKLGHCTEINKFIANENCDIHAATKKKLCPKNDSWQVFKGADIARKIPPVMFKTQKLHKNKCEGVVNLNAIVKITTNTYF